MPRELTEAEKGMAFTLCWNIRQHEWARMAPVDSCPTCRADIVCLVDGPPPESEGARKLRDDLLYQASWKEGDLLVTMLDATLAAVRADAGPLPDKHTCTCLPLLDGPMLGDPDCPVHGADCPFAAGPPASGEDGYAALKARYDAYHDAWMQGRRPAQKARLVTAKAMLDAYLSAAARLPAAPSEGAGITEIAFNVTTVMRQAGTLRELTSSEVLDVLCAYFTLYALAAPPSGKLYWPTDPTYPCPTCGHKLPESVSPNHSFNAYCPCAACSTYAAALPKTAPPSGRVPEVTSEDVAKFRRTFNIEAGCDEPTCMCSTNRRILAAVEYCHAHGEGAR